jgi:outer membrane biosynthesis protein TonB
VSIGDIAEAAGIETSIFESPSTQSTEEVEEQTEPVAEEPIEEPVEEPVEETNEMVSLEAEESEPEEPKESEGVKKRIGKLVEARNEAQAEVERLKAELEDSKNQETRTTQVEQKGLNKFDSIKTSKDLDAREAEAEHLREWLLQNPDGGEYQDITGAEHDVDYESARRLAVETDRDLRKNIPITRDRLRQRDEYTKNAYQMFPWMNDKASKEMIDMQNVLSKNQFIKDYYDKDPVSVITMAYAMEGIKAVQARQNATKKSTPAPAPKAPVPSRAKPSVVKKKSTDKKSLLQQAMSGTREDAASYIEQLL